MDDAYFLKLVIAESENSTGPHKFGAAIVKDQKVISIDHNHVREVSDPSAHAEISAIREACKKLGVYNLPKGCVLYASYEPCLMCFCCAAWAEVEKIVFGTPASEQGSSMYEFNDVSIFEMAKKLQRPIIVERVKAND
jgi:tRNA(Arg) A34 adenosine deaminase TadA